MAMTPDFVLFDVLTRHGVPFVVVGGHAVNFHGFIRGTEDTDVLWIRSPAAEASLLRALEELAAEYIGDEIDPATGIERTHPVTEAFIRGERLMMLCTRSGFLDLFDYVHGYPSVPVTIVWETGVDLDGIRFASLEWLRKLKQAAGRPKDLLDLEQLPPAGDTPTDR
jgi:predicted nucleotidyltransferase